jgi:hypothetical protein
MARVVVLITLLTRSTLITPGGGAFDQGQGESRGHKSGS